MSDDIMNTLMHLSSRVAGAAERYAASDSDVAEVKQTLFAILNTVAPGSAPAPPEPRDKEEALFRQIFDSRWGSAEAILEQARSLFRSMAEPRVYFGFGPPQPTRPWSRKAARLAYLAKILAEYAMAPSRGGEPFTEALLPQSVRPPRRSPAGEAQEPFQQGQMARESHTAWDLGSLSREIDSEIAGLDLLGHE